MTEALRTVPDTSVARAWRLHGAALAFLVLLTLLEFRESVVAAVQVWWIYETYSHCFLILPISLWLVWEQRAKLAQLTPAVELRALWGVPVVLLVWWLGELATINEVRQLAIVGLIQLAIVAMLGTRVYRQIWFPALYLFFLVPAGQYLIAPMQRFATVFVDLFLTLVGIPHHTEGTLVELTNGKFEIAEACAGLRFLIATVALGVLFAYMMFRKWYKIVLFLIACIVVPLIGNGLRIAAIILLAHFTSNAYGVGADHIVYGWGFNVAILLVLFLLGALFRDPHPTELTSFGTDQSTDTPVRMMLAFAVAAALVVAVPAVARWQESRAIEPHVAGLLRPLVMDGWRTDQTMDDWQPDYPDADARLHLSLFRNDNVSNQPIDLFIVYYAHARAAHALTAHINHLWNGEVWTLSGTGSAPAQIGTQRVQMQEWIVTSPAERRMVWAAYWINGRFTSSPLTVKLLQVPAALQGHEGQAIFALSTGIETTDDDARARLSEAIHALNDIPQRLNSTNPDVAPALSN